MTVKEMLGRIGSQEITDWAAIFAIEDEEMEKRNKRVNNNQVEKDEDNEDITDALIAMIESDKAGVD